MPCAEVAALGAPTPVDAAAAFPTAACSAYYRHLDAKSKQPLIGSNIGGGPDLLAEGLAGALGKGFCNELAVPKDVEARTSAARTMYYDHLWMDALRCGCKQFVSLGSGLDTRAWRMPEHDDTVTVFELDVPRCHAYKSKKLAALPGDITALTCARVAIAVDLSKPGWTSKLIESGFNPQLPSFFIAEGLLMYLAQESVPDFIGSVSSLMCPGSTFVACCFVGCLTTMPDQDVLAMYGTQFTFDALTDADLRLLLGSAGLETQAILNNIEVMHELALPYHETEMREERVDDTVDEQKAVIQAGKLVLLASSITRWPKRTGSNCCRSVTESLVLDPMNFHGLRDESRAQKARILQLAKDKGIEFIAKAAVEKANKSSAQDGEASGHSLFIAVKPL